MANDFRLSTALPHHPKLVKLSRRVGQAGAWNLVCLLAWISDNRPDGNLTGLSDEDIEIASQWSGQVGAFVAVLVEVGFLDGQADNYGIHDWAEHNPYVVGRPARIAKARADGQQRWVGTSPEERSNAMSQVANSRWQTISSDKFDPTLEEIFSYYLQKTDRNPKTYEFTLKRKQKGKNRLNECLRKTKQDMEKAKALMMLAIDGLAASDWHMGRDPKTSGKKYCEWEENLFKSYERMELWWNQAPETQQFAQEAGVVH